MRHDHKTIALMERHGPKASMVRDYKTLPFLFLGDFSPANVALPKVDDEIRELMTDNERLKAVFPFERFIVWVVDEGWYSGGYPIVVELGNPAKGTTVVHVKDITVNKLGFTVSNLALYFGLTTDDALGCVVRDHGMLLAHAGNVVEYEKAEEYVGLEGVSTRASGLSTIVTRLITTLRDAMDKHLVEVKPKPISKARAKMLRKMGKPVPKPNNSTHYIYLDAPSYSGGGGTGTGKGSPKRGHNRRGHWRKLTNPRFVRHPQYGKTVWVRPAWIGPTDWTVGDTIYTVRDINVPQVLH